MYFTLLTLSTTNIVMWNCHVDESNRGRNNTKFARDILSELLFNLNVFERVIEADDGTLIGSTAPMVDLGAYIFKDLNTGKITPEESFTNAYVKEAN